MRCTKYMLKKTKQNKETNRKQNKKSKKAKEVERVQKKYIYTKKDMTLQIFFFIV